MQGFSSWIMYMLIVVFFILAQWIWRERILRYIMFKKDTKLRTQEEPIFVTRWFSWAQHMAKLILRAGSALDLLGSFQCFSRRVRQGRKGKEGGRKRRKGLDRKGWKSCTVSFSNFWICRWLDLCFKHWAWLQREVNTATFPFASIIQLIGWEVCMFCTGQDVGCEECHWSDL